MSPAERSARNEAAKLRAAAPLSIPEWGLFFEARATEWDDFADELALRGLDLSDLYAPTAGDALALRGEG